MLETVEQNEIALDKIISPLNAMQLAQLTAFSFTLPPLYFCKEYLNLADQQIIEHCKQRLLTLMNDGKLTQQSLTLLLNNKEYFDADEARLRLMPT